MDRNGIEIVQDVLKDYDAMGGRMNQTLFVVDRVVDRHVVPPPPSARRRRQSSRSPNWHADHAYMVPVCYMVPVLYMILVCSVQELSAVAR
jgi:hypothetical protein